MTCGPECYRAADGWSRACDGLRLTEGLAHDGREGPHGGDPELMDGASGGDVEVPSGARHVGVGARAGLDDDDVVEFEPLYGLDLDDLDAWCEGKLIVDDQAKTGHFAAL